MIRAVVMACALAWPAMAAGQQIVSAPGGDIRVLDKLNGDVMNVTLVKGEPRQVGLLLITLKDCRYPSSNPAGEAYAALSVTYRSDVEPAFNGWMIASSPALNAMDHPRYDVWVISCTT